MYLVWVVKSIRLEKDFCSNSSVIFLINVLHGNRHGVKQRIPGGTNYPATAGGNLPVQDGSQDALPGV